MNSLQVPRKTTLAERVRRLFSNKHTDTAASPLPRSRLAPQGALRPSPARGSASSGWPRCANSLATLATACSPRADLAQAVIQHLARGDVFDAHGEDGYVILFANLSQVQAEFKSRVIAKEIAAKLLVADWAGRRPRAGLRAA